MAPQTGNSEWVRPFAIGMIGVALGAAIGAGTGMWWMMGVLGGVFGGIGYAITHSKD
jgi:hypothetical protein